MAQITEDAPAASAAWSQAPRQEGFPFAGGWVKSAGLQLFLKRLSLEENNVLRLATQCGGISSQTACTVRRHRAGCVEFTPFLRHAILVYCSTSKKCSSAETSGTRHERASLEEDLLQRSNNGKAPSRVRLVRGDAELSGVAAS